MDSAVLSTNISAYKVAVFDEYQRVIDARSLATHKAGGDRAAGLRAFRASQAEWFTRRVRFEALWVDGRKLIYGAMNCGGLGPDEKYGPFCLTVADPMRCNPTAIGVFPGNTAERYVSLAGVVDRDRIDREIGPWEQRAAVAILELAPGVLGAHRHRWSEIVCSKDRFIEVVIAPGPELGQLTATRCRGTYLERLEALEFRKLAGEALTETETWELSAFHALQRWRRLHGVPVEAVA
ncbi:hypothetical protein DVA67_020820 [Solirubrobacter sp. CPCC 204708]|nr:hypothetical protein [Solirubrobacter deserti]